MPSNNKSLDYEPTKLEQHAKRFAVVTQILAVLVLFLAASLAVMYIKYS